MLQKKIPFVLEHFSILNKNKKNNINKLCDRGEKSAEESFL
jgi:hypothetical protein